MKTGRILPVIAAFVLCGALSAAAPASAADTKYEYDTLGRLTKVTFPDGVVIVYAYDAAGNRIAKTVTGAGGNTWGNFTWGQAQW